jgi:hypothetical protein
MQGIDVKLDKAWQGKDIKDLVGAPVSALKGVSETDADLLGKAFGIKTVGDLGKNKFFKAAHAIATLSE